MSAIRDVRSGRGALGGAVRLVLVVSPADDLAAQGALGCGRVVSADHGVELVVGDEGDDTAVAVRGGAQQKVDAATGHRLAQAGKLARLVVHLHGERAHLGPPPARRPAPLPTLNLPGRRADNRLAVPGWRPPRGYPGLDGS